MKKQSAGILLYRSNGNMVEVFLVHPGGPFWAKKDKAAWSIPKGELDPDEEPEAAAKREFMEEVGLPVPDGTATLLGVFKVSSSKDVHAWAIEADIDPKHVKSGVFSMEWPPKSGQEQEFPEVDKAGWFALGVAKEKIVKGQVQILEKLAADLGADLNALPAKKAPKGKAEGPGQTSLF